MLALVLVTSVTGTIMLGIDAGEYRPLYLNEETPMISVESFQLDELPVSNRQYLDFVQKNQKWKKERIPGIFAEKQYLQHWIKMNESWQPREKEIEAAVTNVSWFAAESYCQSLGKRLPTVAEWEYVGRASETEADGSNDPAYNQRILTWYGKANSQVPKWVNRSPANVWGIKDMHGLIWEWTDDFNSSLVSGESRADSSLDQTLFCGAGAAGAADPSDYAAFMRFAFRSSLQASFTLNNLGFRCAKDTN